MRTIQSGSEKSLWIKHWPTKFKKERKSKNRKIWKYWMSRRIISSVFAKDSLVICVLKCSSVAHIFVRCCIWFYCYCQIDHHSPWLGYSNSTPHIYSTFMRASRLPSNLSRIAFIIYLFIYEKKMFRIQSSHRNETITKKVEVRVMIELDRLDIYMSSALQSTHTYFWFNRKLMENGN